MVRNGLGTPYKVKETICRERPERESFESEESGDFKRNDLGHRGAFERCRKIDASLFKANCLF